MDVFLDQDGLLRVGGRLKNASLPTTVKHPVLIPKDHPISRTIIAYCHERVQHQGKGITINELRSQGYWVQGMNRAVATYLHQCVTYRKLRRFTEEQ